MGKERAETEKCLYRSLNSPLYSSQTALISPSIALIVPNPLISSLSAYSHLHCSIRLYIQHIIMEHMPRSKGNLPSCPVLQGSFPPFSGVGSPDSLIDWALRSDSSTFPCGKSEYIQGRSCWECSSRVDQGKLVCGSGKSSSEDGKNGLAGISQHCKVPYNPSGVAFRPQKHSATPFSVSKSAPTASLHDQNSKYGPTPSKLLSSTELTWKNSHSQAYFEGLLQLSEQQGALKAKLKQITDQVNRRKVAITCFSCRNGERLYLYSGCGHGVCGKCAEKGKTHCQTCGKPGKLVLLDPVAARM